jgi:hypothetical protein
MREWVEAPWASVAEDTDIPNGASAAAPAAAAPDDADCGGGGGVLPTETPPLLPPMPDTVEEDFTRIFVMAAIPREPTELSPTRFRRERVGFRESSARVSMRFNRI